jgi:hypothetical protein
MRRFCEVKHGRMIQLAGDMTAAANAIREARERARWVKYERNFPAKEPDSEWRLRQPKSWPPKRSRSRASMTCAPGWSYDETESDYHETWCRSPAMRCGRSSSNPIVCGGAKSSRQAANSPESALNSAQIHANAAGSAR